jgi:putative oxidoreductase
VALRFQDPVHMPHRLLKPRTNTNATAVMSACLPKGGSQLSMKVAVMIVRTLMGLLFLFASISVLFNLIQQPELTGNVKTFMDGVKATGYLLTLIKLTELVCGIAFVTGRFVALACVVIAPIIVNIFLFHIFVDPTGLPVAISLVLANSFLAYANWDKYKPLLTAK